MKINTYVRGNEVGGAFTKATLIFYWFDVWFVPLAIRFIKGFSSKCFCISGRFMINTPKLRYFTSPISA